MNATPPLTRQQGLTLQLWSELSIHCLLTMEAIWAATWYQALQGFRNAWIAVFMVIVVFFITGYWSSRLLSELKFKRRWQRFFFAVWLVLALAASIKALVYPDVSLPFLQLFGQPLQAIFSSVPERGEFWHLLVFFLLVLRAIDIARSPIDQRRLMVSFQIGIFAFMIYGVVFSLAIQTISLIPLFLFLFFALIMLACGRISQISELRGGRLPGIQTLWTAGIALAAFFLILAALLAGWIFDIALARAVATVIFLAMALLMAIFLLMLSPFLFAIDAFVRWLQERFTSPEAQETFKSINQLLDKVGNADQSLKNIANVLEKFEPYLLIAILALVLVTAILWLGWRPVKRALVGEQESQNLPAPPLKVNFPRLSKISLPGRRRANQLLGAARIRQIYSRLLTLSAHLGVVRPPARTPVEFLPALVTLFPDHPAELELITRSYLRVRYGMLPETDAEVNDVVNAWKSVDRTGQKLAVLLKKQSSANKG
ncbi:MAG TPA: DUF4129 domain-containing protein [Longilinea sp.]|nr:DUF4129 domain-containing protein [Longilinea sp.]